MAVHIQNQIKASSSEYLISTTFISPREIQCWASTKVVSMGLDAALEAEALYEALRSNA